MPTIFGRHFGDHTTRTQEQKEEDPRGDSGLPHEPDTLPIFLSLSSSQSRSSKDYCECRMNAAIRGVGKAIVPAGVRRSASKYRKRKRPRLLQTETAPNPQACPTDISAEIARAMPRPQTGCPFSQQAFRPGNTVGRNTLIPPHFRQGSGTNPLRGVSDYSFLYRRSGGQARRLSAVSVALPGNGGRSARRQLQGRPPTNGTNWANRADQAEGKLDHVCEPSSHDTNEAAKSH